MNAILGKDILEAARLLKVGKLVAIPTETVYGLAANALDGKAVVKIFEAKKRPGFDPLIVHIGKFEQVAEIAANFPEKAQLLTDKYWPGPLTIVLPKRALIPDIVTSGLNSVGIRMPSHKLTAALLNQINFPVAAPSANPFGYVSPTTAKHVADQLGDRIDYILDGGPCSVGVESTIVSFLGPKPKVLRLGGLSLEKIEMAIGKVEVEIESSSNPVAPGMLTGHYAPRKPVILGDLDYLIKEQKGKDFAVLAFSDKRNFKGEVLSSKGDMHEAARNLFAAMRRLDEMDVEIILAETVPPEGLGRAINDRLKRAAHEKYHD